MKKELFILLFLLSLVSCNTNKKPQKKSQESTKIAYATVGKQYAMATQKVLGKSLMGKIKKEGTLAALQFCNEKAYPLTDSMSVVNNVKIRRVSDKNRNKENNATARELEYIERFKSQVLKEESLTPIVKEFGEEVHAYYPIITMPKCLQCHGDPGKQIVPTVFKSIQKLYPEDKAIGYVANEIRGMWHITFNK